MDLMVLVLGCVFCSVRGLLFWSCDITVSVSNARFCIQFFFLVWRLYFGPLCSSAISWSVNIISVLLITLGWKSCFDRGVVVCNCSNLLSLMSSLRYLD